MTAAPRFDTWAIVVGAPFRAQLDAAGRFRTCPWCGRRITRNHGQGRPKKTCGRQTCQRAAARAVRLQRRGAFSDLEHAMRWGTP